MWLGKVRSHHGIPRIHSSDREAGLASVTRIRAAIVGGISDHACELTLVLDTLVVFVLAFRSISGHDHGAAQRDKVPAVARILCNTLSREPRLLPPPHTRDRRTRVSRLGPGFVTMKGSLSILSI